MNPTGNSLPARARGLRLAFRVVLNAKDTTLPGAPDYVRAAGAEGYMEEGTNNVPLWTPVVTDPIFRQKFQKFLEAFGREYDHPEFVDYIDALGIGWWGEVHHLKLAQTSKPEVYNWFCAAYARSFHRVLLGTQIHSELNVGDSLDTTLAIGKYGYVARIDSLGSFWLKPARTELEELTRTTPFFGESCYFSLTSWQPWKNAREPYQKERDVLDGTMRDALEFHANTLDLRAPGDANTWMKLAPDLVQRFVREGGYRFCPVKAAYPEVIRPGRPFAVQHFWRNYGVGMLPNDNVRWNRKCRVAFALLPETGGTPVSTFVDGQTDPGAWVGSELFPCSTQLSFTVVPGAYQLAVALVDTTERNRPVIILATGVPPDRAAWVPLGSIKMSAGD